MTHSSIAKSRQVEVWNESRNIGRMGGALALPITNNNYFVRGFVMAEDTLQKKNIITSINEDQIKHILQYYDLGSFKSITRIAGGLANTNCKLETENGVYLMKICDDKSYEELFIQIEFLLHCKQHGFFTSYPHRMKSTPPGNGTLKEAQHYIYYDGTLRVIIFDFLQGSSKKFKDVTPKIMTQLGTSLAKLHRLPTLPALPQLAFGVNAIEPFIHDSVGKSHENHPFMSTLKKQIQRLKPLVNNPELPAGIMHADLFPDNALFQDEDLVAIVDWEEVSLGPLILDVAMTIIGCCYPRDNVQDPELVKAFVDAYSALRPLTEIEMKYLDDFIDYSALAIAFWRFRQFNVRTPDPLLKDKYIEMENRLRF